jgi:transposase InsO family protein
VPSPRRLGERILRLVPTTGIGPRQRDRRLTALVRASFDASKQRYGSPRIHEDLREQRERVSRKRVIRLMQEEGLKARVRKRFTCTTMSDHDQPVADNLLDRQFTADAPNQRWVTLRVDSRTLWAVTLAATGRACSPERDGQSMAKQ